MVDTDEEKTPLQQKLDEFAQQLSKVSSCTVELIFYVTSVATLGSFIHIQVVSLYSSTVLNECSVGYIILVCNTLVFSFFLI